MQVILVNTNRQNVWIMQHLLAAKLSDVKYHQTEHRAIINMEEDFINISFQPVTPYIITLNTGHKAQLTQEQLIWFIDP